jgi:2-oxoglutarate ferredoxin oxidoreductase subunit beta
MDMTVVIFDNGIYGLTKNQTSPTSPAGLKTNTHPLGITLPPQNPLTITLGISNVSFVAQTVDWNPAHLYATLRAAFDHKGFSFVRVLQRCPAYTANMFEALQKDPARLLLLTNDTQQGISLDPSVARLFPTTHQHDPRDLASALKVAVSVDPVPIGLLYQDAERPCYNTLSAQGIDMGVDEKLRAIDHALDSFAV